MHKSYIHAISPPSDAFRLLRRSDVLLMGGEYMCACRRTRTAYLQPASMHALSLSLSLSLWLAPCLHMRRSRTDTVVHNCMTDTHHVLSSRCPLQAQGKSTLTSNPPIACSKLVPKRAEHCASTHTMILLRPISILRFWNSEGLTQA